MNKVILVTNDDGIHAKGILELIAVAKSFGKVLVVAPTQHLTVRQYCTRMPTPAIVAT